MKEPVDHIIRPRLPWRSPDDPAVTECGYDASKVKALTREQYKERLKELGQQRSAMLTCMTCANTSERWSAWDDDPRQALEREITWEGSGRWAHNDRGTRLKHELIAIAALVENHRDEFVGIVTENEQRRAWLEKKAALQERPKPKSVPPIGGL